MKEAYCSFVTHRGEARSSASIRCASRVPQFSRVCAGLLLVAATALSSAAAGFEAYPIRPGASGLPQIIPQAGGAVEFRIVEGGQKAGYGSSDFDGNALGNIGTLAITRLDSTSRFPVASGPACAPYFNLWITDGKGHYAVVANEPTDSAFQPLFNNGYNLNWTVLANKVAKIYETSDLSWLPTKGSSGIPTSGFPGRSNAPYLYTFADLAGFIVQAPPAAKLALGWPGLGGGAPREYLTNRAWGVNWIFGDSVANYISGDAPGYLVSAPSVNGPAATTVSLVKTSEQLGGSANNLAGVAGDYAPGFATDSIKAAASIPGAKSEIQLSTLELFGRAVFLGEIKSMSYWTKTGQTHAIDPRDWYLALYTIKPDAALTGWYGSRLGCEPYFSAAISETAGAWNQWASTSATNQLRYFESTYGYFGSYTDPDWLTLIGSLGLKTQMPLKNEKLMLFTVQTGSAWANGFTGQLDGLRIELFNGSLATVNFEGDEAPVVTDVVVSPNIVALGSTTAITVTATVDDTLTGGSNIKSADFRVALGPWVAMAAADTTFDERIEAVTGSFILPASITEAGIYAVDVRGTDALNLSDTASTQLVVYDPSAGFVTGGGWIMSPAGAYQANLTAAGKANFAFVCKYQKGASVPQGSTEFSFTAAGLKFHSSSFEWLVVNQGGTNAQFKGVGKLNDAGNHGFMVWATDGGSTGQDKFRILIWDRDNADAVVYDNGTDQAIGGGNIMVQTGKK